MYKKSIEYVLAFERFVKFNFRSRVPFFFFIHNTQAKRREAKEIPSFFFFILPYDFNKPVGAIKTKNTKTKNRKKMSKYKYTNETLSV